MNGFYLWIVCKEKMEKFDVDYIGCLILLDTDNWGHLGLLEEVFKTGGDDVCGYMYYKGRIDDDKRVPDGMPLITFPYFLNIPENNNDYYFRFMTTDSHFKRLAHLKAKTLKERLVYTYLQTINDRYPVYFDIDEEMKKISISHYSKDVKNKIKVMKDVLAETFTIPDKVKYITKMDGAHLYRHFWAIFWYLNFAFDSTVEDGERIDTPELFWKWLASL